MLHVTIDGKSIEVPERITVLQAAKIAGIQIPTLCDHPSLKPFGNCRMCIVEIEGFRTLQASCTLPVSQGMVIRTNTPKVKASRKFLLSLLFSERNHFCMFCQKTDGDCELQNCAYEEGMDHWPMQPNWNPFPVDASHPYAVLDNNRCILCRRCVRACGELVGNYTLGIENRGPSSTLIADYGLPWGESSCVKCGTCVQVCPTGALIDRESAYLGKDIKSEHVLSTCIGCSVGCGVDLIVSNNQLLHIDGDWNDPVNAGVLCEEGRYKALQRGKQRLTTPMVRKDGKLEATTWEQALEAVARRIAPLKSKGSLSALVSTRLPIEALSLFKQIFTDHLQGSSVAGIEEATTTGIQHNLDVDLNGKLDEIKKADCIVAMGVDLGKNHQVAGFLIKRKLIQGTRLIVIDLSENALETYATYSLSPKAGSDEELLKGIMASIENLGLDRSQTILDLSDSSPEKVAKETGISAELIVATAREIAVAQKPVFIFGKGVTAQPNAELVLTALYELSKMVGGNLVSTKGKANSLAAHAFDLDRSFEPKDAMAVYIALGDDEPYGRMLKNLGDVPFLAVQASYISPLTEKADVVFPVEMWTEQEGHYLSMEARLQQTRKAIAAPQNVLPNVEVLRRLASCLGVEVHEDWQKVIYKQVPAAFMDVQAIL